MIDLHTHLLPGIDDGPPTMAGSLKLAWAACGADTTEMVATPHVSWNMPNTAQIVREGVAAVQSEIDAAGIPIRVHTGGELALSKAAELDDEELTALHLGGGEWLLAECPLSVTAAGFEPLLLHLQRRGHRILLAHPERSPALHRSPETLARLVDAGMLAQITAGSLIGAFGSVVQRFAFELVAEDLVHNVASDTHNVTSRPPGMLAAIEQADEEFPGLAERAGWLCHDVPRAILSGATVPLPPGPAPQPRRRRRFRASRRR